MNKCPRNILLDNLFQDGLISIDDLDNNHKIEKILQKYEKKNLNYIVDHKNNIIDIAKQFRMNSQYEYAMLLYATFFEHTLNSVIDKVCYRKKIEKKMINQIIKNTTIDAKTSWLLNLLDLPPLSTKHKKQIQKVSERRNSFVHYKFDPKEDLNIEEDFNNIEKTVIYMKKYESRVLFFNNKTKATQKINKQSNSPLNKHT